MSEEVFISMPYYNTPETIDRAISSILAQSHENWRLSIIVDGCEPPEVPDDPRITVFQLEENRGCFYASALNLAICQSTWFTVHDSDDWSEPDRYETLLRLAKGYDAVVDGLVRYALNGRIKQHQSTHTGLFKTEKLRLCGPHPDFRVSWDTAMWKLFSVSNRTRFAKVYKYHAVKREASLTVSAEFGAHSEHRKRAHKKRNSLVNRCLRAHPRRWPEILKPSEEAGAALQRDIERYHASRSDLPL